MLDEMERSVHDALCVVKRVLEGKKLVVGGGAVETALDVYLENFALNLVFLNIFFFLLKKNLKTSREQLAVAAFADALLVIPKTLATNAAQDAISLLAKLRAFHNKSQNDKKFEDLKWFLIFFS